MKEQMPQGQVNDTSTCQVPLTWKQYHISNIQRITNSPCWLRKSSFNCFCVITAF